MIKYDNKLTAQEVILCVFGMYMCVCAVCMYIFNSLIS